MPKKKPVDDCPRLGFGQCSAQERITSLETERNKPEPEVAPQGNEWPNCRNCVYIRYGQTIHCFLARVTPLGCINGDAFIQVAPIRLYATGGDSDSTG